MNIQTRFDVASGDIIQEMETTFRNTVRSAPSTTASDLRTIPNPELVCYI
jgi:hypothetical protein